MTCHTCRYYIKSESRCLLEYEGFNGIEKIKNGLSGWCKDYAPFIEYEEATK